jgi:hypothetical protein
MLQCADSSLFIALLADFVIAATGRNSDNPKKYPPETL